MKKYFVRVNDAEYHVEVEQVSDNAAASVTPKAPPAPVSGGGKQILAPMPGTILTVNVKQGQAVKSGQVLMILEAMKMENEIMAPKDGTITSVSVQAGASVENGTLLCSLS